jgi:hypothetical protein
MNNVGDIVIYDNKYAEIVQIGCNSNPDEICICVGFYYEEDLNIWVKTNTIINTGINIKHPSKDIIKYSYKNYKSYQWSRKELFNFGFLEGINYIRNLLIDTDVKHQI